MENELVTVRAELEPEQLYRACDFGAFKFETTEELDSPDYPLIGQDRALNAADFGIRMQRDGYNIYALGPEATDKRNLMEEVIQKVARERPVPNDWCYVCNFKDENKPIAVELPVGKAEKLREMMESFIEDLPNILNSAFESEEYQNRRQTLEEQLKDEELEAFSELQDEAKSKGLTVLSTPIGYTFSPTKEGRLMTMEEINNLSAEEKNRLEKEIEEFQKRLQKLLRQIPERQRKFRKLRVMLNKEFAEFSIKDLLEEIRSGFTENEQVLGYLDEVRKDILDHVDEILNPGSFNPFLKSDSAAFDKKQSPLDHPVLWRYTVNVMTNHTGAVAAPIVYEDNPTYNNLIGRIEHVSEMGTLTTDFTFIKPGALLNANGGYLILDVQKVLTHPFAWEGLKRALQSGKLKIESPADMYGLYSTVTVEPDSIDLNVKVVLIGSRLFYYLLCAYDSDFKNLFKVDVDFEDEVDWNSDNQMVYARLIAGLVSKYNLSPLHRSAVSRVIEHASRLVSDNEKVSTHIKHIVDLLRESDYWARHNGAGIIERKHVQEAIEQQKYRSGRLKDRIQEEIIRKTIFIDTEGEKVGQVNGLSVLMFGNSTFGHPARITARVKIGNGEVLDIEREVEMSGPIHSKGVLILSSYLGSHYSLDTPLSLSASLVFEQSYSGVEGDSASSTELYALLSAIADVPLKQSLAVTGSVNQHGEIQPIGGVNEKIEGFFDICKKRGLKNGQGVIIPRANIKNLMLKEEVVQAVREGIFHIYPVTTIEEGMELLTEKEMGSRNEKGLYPDGTINFMIEEKLKKFALIRSQYASQKTNGTQGRDEK